MPLVSVIIAVRNGARYIAETVESVLAQSYNDFELIIVDDGSTDSTPQIVSEFADPRIKIFSYPPSGVSISRNQGFALSTGKYISFLDADDLWSISKVEDQVSALEKSGGALVAYSWVDSFDSYGADIAAFGRSSYSGDVFNALVDSNFLCCGSNMLIERSAFSQTGGFDSSIDSAEDWDLALRLAKRYHFVLVSKPQIRYRIRPDSISADIFRMETASLLILKRLDNSSIGESNKDLSVSRSNLYSYLCDRALTSRGSLGQRKFTAVLMLFNWLRAVPPTKLPIRLMTRKLKHIVFCSGSGIIRPANDTFASAETTPEIAEVSSGG